MQKNDEQQNNAHLQKSDEQWHWQPSGTAWHGVGVYHVTLAVPSRQPLLGRLVIPDNDPVQAVVERTPLGNAVVDELYVMCKHYPEVRLFQFCLMPDHLHFVVMVTRVMKASIRSVIRGYWQGVKKLGRAYTLSLAPELNSGTLSLAPELNSGTTNEGRWAPQQGAALQGATTLQGADVLQGAAAPLPAAAGEHWAFPVFTERPFIRPLSRRGQLQAMIKYVKMNPQRLATKRLMPGFFRVQHGIMIAGRSYDCVGNVALLHAERYVPVHVRHTMVEAAAHGDGKALRDYMNGCVLAARGGAVMVSPFISPDEKRVMNVLLKEQWPMIVLADNGFRDYYKPSDVLFDGCAAGRVLIVSPWLYDAGKRHISRADCVALNKMAEEICFLTER